MFLAPDPYVRDRNGVLWPRTGTVRGECDQHYFVDDWLYGRGHWEGESCPSQPDDPLYPKAPTNVSAPSTTVGMRGLSCGEGGCGGCCGMAGLDQPAREPWTHALVARWQRERGVPGASTPYPACCCAQTHEEHRVKGALYGALFGAAVGGLARGGLSAGRRGVRGVLVGAAVGAIAGYSA